MLWTLLFTEGEVGQGHKKGHMFTVNVVTSSSINLASFSLSGTLLSLSILVWIIV